MMETEVKANLHGADVDVFVRGSVVRVRDADRWVIELEDPVILWPDETEIGKNINERFLLYPNEGADLIFGIEETKRIIDVAFDQMRADLLDALK